MIGFMETDWKPRQDSSLLVPTGPSVMPGTLRAWRLVIGQLRCWNKWTTAGSMPPWHRVSLPRTPLAGPLLQLDRRSRETEVLAQPALDEPQIRVVQLSGREQDERRRRG